MLKLKEHVINFINMEELATFAGGCFWCMEAVFAELEGVKEVVSGYTGGNVENPTYEEVCSGSTGHYESIQIKFNREVIDYKKLLELFWQNIDPFDFEGQFVDKGSQYKTAIFYYNDEQKHFAEESKETIRKLFDKEVATEIKEAVEFYPAEDYHQKYYKKCPIKYKIYKEGSKRKEILSNLWENEKR